jgi:uncharacterized protein YlxW (UPF0749 family)
MGLKTYADKLDDCFERPTLGKVEKIQPSHLEKVTTKLQAKKQQRPSEIEKTTKDSKKARLERKVLFANEHIKRAEMLLTEINSSAEAAAGVDVVPRNG